MKYFLDTEFLEGTQKTWLGQSKPTIDLISIGIVAEDGREYYAISKDFNLKEAWNRYELENDTTVGARIGCIPPKKKVYWIRDNVLKPIFQELLYKGHKEANLELPKVNKKIFTYKNMKKFIKFYGKTNKQIAEEVYEFCSNNYHKGNSLTYEQRKAYPLYDMFKPEFYGYYSDYDWVVFCWLFGKMIDFPKGFPMYCIDLQQTLDEKANSFTSMELSKLVHPNCEHNVFELLGNSKFNLTNLGCLQSHKDYPKQTNEHSAIHDARWNYELYKFLNIL